MAADATETRPPSTPQTRYPQETRDLARELWGYKHGRNCEAVAAALQESLPGITGRTVRSWAADGDWAAWLESAVRRAAPTLYRGILVDLIVNATEAPAILRAAQRGECDPAQARIAAVSLSLVGISPRQAGDPLTLPAEGRLAHLTDADIAALPEDELDALLAGEDGGG